MAESGVFSAVSVPQRSNTVFRKGRSWRWVAARGAARGCLAFRGVVRMQRAGVLLWTDLVGVTTDRRLVSESNGVRDTDGIHPLGVSLFCRTASVSAAGTSRQ